MGAFEDMLRMQQMLDQTSGPQPDASSVLQTPAGTPGSTSDTSGQDQSGNGRIIGVKDYLADALYQFGEKAKDLLGATPSAVPPSPAPPALPDASNYPNQQPYGLPTSPDMRPSGLAGQYQDILDQQSQNMVPVPSPQSVMANLPQNPAPVNALAQSLARFGPGGQQVPRFDTSRQNLQANLPDRIAGIRGFLSNILGGAAAAGYKHVGLPTPLEQQKTLSEINETNARSRLYGTQADMMGQQVTIQTPQGPVTGSLATLKNTFPAMFQERGRETAATTAANARIMTEGLKLMAEQGTLSRMVAGINPQTGEPGMEMFNKFGQSMGFAPNSIVTQMIQRTSDTVQYIQTPNGWQVVPKHTTTTPVLPGGPGIPSTTPGAVPTGGVIPGNPPARPDIATLKRMAAQRNASKTGGGGAIARPITDAAGNPIPSTQSQQPVIGTDTNGNQVLAAASEAPNYGLRDVRKAGAAEAEKVTNARNLLTLLDNSDPNNPGVMQLIGQLEAQGNLGPLMGRWNEFLAGKVGIGDPLYTQLRTKLDKLSSTALMQVHVGARGGSNLMEHFADLANSGKMDGPSLRAAVQAEEQYVKEKSMYPGGIAPGQTATHTDGSKWRFNGGNPSNVSNWSQIR